MHITPEWVSAAASIVAAISVALAYWQLRVSKNIAQLQFEDGLAKEYRDLASRIPTKALLGHPLSEEAYLKAFDEFYRYIDLTNEQVSLRQRDRISKAVWESWCVGIRSNLALDPFQLAWAEIKRSSHSFQELRRLEDEDFISDPAIWRSIDKDGS